MRPPLITLTLKSSAVALLTLAAFLSVLIAHGLVHCQITNVGRPYETWDEIATYNTAKVISGPTAGRVFRYGSLDTLLQWMAIEVYRYFDSVGRAYENPSYANVVEPSFSDSRLYLRPKTWSGVDFNYFRGLSDHEPIFLSRQFHLAAVYLIAIAAGVIALAVYGPTGGLALLPLLSLLSAPAVYEEAALSLPNAAVAVLTFVTVFLALAAYDKSRSGYLVGSAVALAIAINFKIDAILVGVAPALVLILIWRERGFAFAIKAAVVSAAAFIAATFVTRPSMFGGPFADMYGRWYAFNHAEAEIGYNVFQQHYTLNSLEDCVRTFARVVEQNLFISGMRSSAALVAAMLALVAISLIAYLRRSRSDIIVIIGVCSPLFLWTAVFFIYPHGTDRYFLNGIAACYATIGIFLILNRDSDNRFCRYARPTIVCFLIFQFGYNGFIHAREAIALYKSYAVSFGFDPVQNRTKATLVALEMREKVDGDVAFLVDQHGYFDIRLLRLRGGDLQYINMYNVDDVLRSLSPSKTYIVLFSKGTTDRKGIAHPTWAGDWNENQKTLYRTYLSKLLRLPVVRRFSGAAQVVLDPGPVRPNDDIYVSLLAKSAPANVLP